MPIPIRIGRKTRIGDFPCVVIDYAFPERRRPSLLAGDASAGENACSHAAMLRPASSHTRTLKRMRGRILAEYAPVGLSPHAECPQHDDQNQREAINMDVPRPVDRDLWYSLP